MDAFDGFHERVGDIAGDYAEWIWSQVSEGDAVYAVPQDTGPMGNPLANSSEVIVTGSIDLPRSFGATGVHPSQIDSSDVDRLFLPVRGAPHLTGARDEVPDLRDRPVLNRRRRLARRQGEVGEPAAR